MKPDLDAMQEGTRNPYATPKSAVADGGASAEAEAVRREHITHEASVKSAGFLFILGGLGTLAGAVGFVTSAIPAAAERPGFLVIGIALAALSVAYIVVGWGVRGLRQRARIPAMVLAAVGLLGFPVGTLINAYILWLVASRKGRMVFSTEYAVIIEATPGVKYRTSLVAWIVLALIVLVIVALVVGLPLR